MKLINFFYSINVLFLYLWYVISIPIIYSDKTISPVLMTAFEAVSVLMIVMTFRVMVFSYKNPSWNDFVVNIMMFFWFSFITYRDMITDYDMLTKLLYVSIDFSSIIFILDTFINMILEKIKIPSLRENGDKLKNIFRLCIAGGCLFAYSISLRGIINE
jgi:hypothetical protein